MDGWVGNICVGQFIEHRFAVLIRITIFDAHRQIYLLGHPYTLILYPQIILQSSRTIVAVLTLKERINAATDAHSNRRSDDSVV